MTTPNNTPAGWYPDPENPSLNRYWDGSNWAPQTQTPPPAAPMGGPGAPAPPSYQTSYTSFEQTYKPNDTVTMFVVSILTFVICPLLAIWSFVLSNKARKDADALGMKADGLVNASYVISVIGLVYMGLAIVFGFFWFLLVLSVSA